MPFIDYSLTTNIELTKEDLTKTELTKQITKDLDLGIVHDKRTWNKQQLKTLALILCNLVKHHREDGGIFLYSRDKTKNLAKGFNPNGVGYRSLIFVIDKLVDAKILDGVKAPPREKGKPDPKLSSQFMATQQALDLAYSLGINNTTIDVSSTFHVRLRDHLNSNHLIEFKHNEYTKHIEMLMAQYSHYLNQQSIMGKTDDETDKGIVEWGTKLGGEKIHLYRNFKTWSKNKDVEKEYEQLFNELPNPDFAFGGRSGGYWQSGIAGLRKNRPTYLINGNKTNKADFPCSHINLCYKHETNNWFQTETYKELKEEGRENEDAYIIAPSVHRDLAKQMIQMMFNIKGRASVSREFNAWLKEDADKELVRARKKCNLSNIQIMELLEEKHQPIKDYFYKGKLVGQIIQWEESNLIHHLAWEFCSIHDIPCISVYDELITEEEHTPMVKEFMYSGGYCEVCNKYSLMNQIKGLKI